jgi:hypothetical protein
LHAEYDAQRAANGGHLLYIPDDWDGPALPVNDHVALCIDCGDTFAMSKHAKGTKVRCEECQARRTRETWQAKRKRPAAAWPIDIADV